MPVYNQLPQSIISSTDMGTTFRVIDTSPVMYLMISPELIDGEPGGGGGGGGGGNGGDPDGPFGPGFGPGFAGGGSS
jgi:hypothetical protein